jgi:endonuclease/exonuclease/phosphatase family metal-dependent hydrolase
MLAAQLADVYPHSFREATQSDEHRYFECTTSAFKLWRLKGCVDDACQTQSLFQCVGDGGVCRDEYASIPEDCQRCLAANALSPTKCLLRAPTTAYHGRNGLMLLSRHPLEDARYEDYDTGILRRGVISARVKDYEVLCTHMTSDLADVPPYPAEDMPFDSWAEEHMAQVVRLGQLAAADRCTVLMGDMNSGPGTEATTPELGAHYDAFLAEGYSEPWTDPVCTFCSSNPLVCIDDEATGQSCADQSSLTLDHVFFSSACAGGASYRRILDQPVDVQTTEEQITTRLSDHYGLLVEHYAELF